MKYEELDSILERLNFSATIRNVRFEGYGEWIYMQGFHYFLKVKIEKDGHVDFYFNDTNLFGSIKLEDMTVFSLFEFLPIPRNTDTYKSVKKESIRNYNIDQIISS